MVTVRTSNEISNVMGLFSCNVYLSKTPICIWHPIDHFTTPVN